MTSNKIILFLILAAMSVTCITGCSKSDEPVLLQGTGTVLDFAGTGHCSVIIELDNGTRIQPLHHPEGFDFTEGQKVAVEYFTLPDMVSTCGQGEVCNIVSITETGCGSPLTLLDRDNYNIIPNDPVYLHEVYTDGDCLRVKVSFAGGCTIHAFHLGLVQLGQDENGTALLELRHDSKGDMCEAFLTKELSFSLEQLRETGIEQFVFSALLIDGVTFTREFELDY
jgi:hypothetical protein